MRGWPRPSNLYSRGFRATLPALFLLHLLCCATSLITTRPASAPSPATTAGDNFLSLFAFFMRSSTPRVRRPPVLASATEKKTAFWQVAGGRCRWGRTSVDGGVWTRLFGASSFLQPLWPRGPPARAAGRARAGPSADSGSRRRLPPPSFSSRAHPSAQLEAATRVHPHAQWRGRVLGVPRAVGCGRRRSLTLGCTLVEWR